MPSLFVRGLMATLLAGSAAAHMEMDYPAPFRSKFNPNAVNIDYTNTAPLSPDGSNYPCKGYHSDLGTSAGSPTAQFALGGQYNVSIVGGAPHGGGSCQISLSYDRGQTFTVIESIVGGCGFAKQYPFTIPPDAQTGEAILSWSWHNQVGNREMYQNCAAVTITGGGAKRVVKQRAASFQARPQIFVANIGNGCTVGEGAPVEYPNPGPDVEGEGAGAVAPTGNCGSSGNGGGAPAPTEAPAPVPTEAPATTQAPPATEAPAAPTETATIPGGVFITIPTDGASAAPAPTEVTVEPVAPAPTTAVEAPATTEAPVAPVPTTLQTATKVTAAPAPTGTGTGSDSGAGSGSGSGSGGAFAAGTACSPEGAWNCINGTSFQRCASGAWSAIIPMAAGTTCTPGQSDSLSMKAIRGRRVVRARKL